MQTRDCVTVSNSPKCPLQLQIMLISYHLTLSTLAFASRFLCGSGTSDCLGPSLTKPKVLGGSGGGGGGMLPWEILNSCVALDCIFKAVTLIS